MRIALPTLLLCLAATPLAAKDDFADGLLAAHNRMRCLHGAPPLVWDDAIAAQAAAVAKQGFKHSDSYRSPLGPLGENLFVSTRPQPPAAIVQRWYEEGRRYRYDLEARQPGTGHFTALVWQGVRTLGCGRAGDIVACQYGTGKRALDCQVPNMSGCYLEQVKPPLAPAPSCP